ncbi:hypothetical protein GTU79_05190 [Sodalis ligni]|uniref:Type III secretion system (T3SS) chaperone-like protein n=1 Tax=Sodalis ligni TaxID=2697027 RepID=A0A4R1NI56_9GAMM|nr:hypothetical protein [Sodalis ligni]QWA12161.1 hypothetical protein GTU79_05190 [Sodalis ligni]TCL04426.1 type III secretion system (T3SS) chaperone-like protein [Sodalis ligni]
MERFIQSVYDHFELLPDEDNVFNVDEDTFIYLGEQSDVITLLCPCFPVPHEQHSLMALLALNCQGDTIYGAEEGIVVARRVVDTEASAVDMAQHFNAFIGDIFSAKKFFVPG